MTRQLLTIFAVGLIVSAASFAAAASFGGFDWNEEREKDGPTVVRDMNWAGASDIDIGDGLDVTFRQGPTVSMVATGPENLVNRLRVDGGKVRLAKRDNEDKKRSFTMFRFSFSDPKGLSIAMTAPDVSKFSVQGGASLRLHDVKRPNLTVASHSGSSLEGDIEVETLAAKANSGASLELSGRATKVDVAAHSGARVDLEEVVAREGAARVNSGASISLAATESVTAEAHSGGAIDLHGRPARLSTSEHSGGSIDVEHARHSDMRTDAEPAPKSL